MKILEKTHTDPLLSYRGKWKNLYFLKDGRSALGDSSYDTEKLALEAVNDAERLVLPNPEYYLTDNDHKKFGAPINSIKTKDYSHTIQIPTGD